MNKQFKEAIKKSGKGLGKMLPVIAGVILLIGLVNTLIPKSFYTELFRGNFFLDPLIGSVMGSILAGSPITSYVLGGELLNQGVTLIAVTAFIVSWVTVGFVQLPAESMILGKKFAITRNVLSFVFAIVVAIITVGILNVI